MNDLPPNSGNREEEELPAFQSWKQIHQPPKGYFDTLPGRVIDRYHAEQPSKHNRVLSFRRMITAAAVLTGLSLGVAWWTDYTRRSVEPQPVSSAEALLYIMENIHEFEPLILQSIPADTGKALQGGTSNEVEEYLLEELQEEDFENLF